MNMIPRGKGQTVPHDSIVVDIPHYPPLAPKTNYQTQAVDTYEHHDYAYFFGDDVANNRKREKADPKDKHDAAKCTVGTLPSETALPVAFVHYRSLSMRQFFVSFQALNVDAATAKVRVVPKMPIL